MLIRMLQDQRGSVDGVAILPYLRGEVYDMSKTKGHVELAETFLSQNWATIHDSQQTQDSANSGTVNPEGSEVKSQISGNRKRR